MAKYNNDTKHDAMRRYAEGETLQAISDAIGCHHNTVIGWKSGNDPQDWEIFKEAVGAEKAKAALTEIRKKTAETVGNQLDDTIKLRKVARRLLIELVNEIIDGKRNVSESSVKMLRDLERTFHGIQQQQNACFDLPTHRLKIADQKSPFAMSDEELREMPNSELMRMILNINAPEDED